MSTEAKKSAECMTHRIIDFIGQLLQCMVEDPLLRCSDLRKGTSNRCLRCSPLRDGAVGVVSEPTGRIGLAKLTPLDPGPPG